MENLNLHKQKLYAVILAGVGLISLFLPWATVRMGGFGGGSVNGLRGWGFLALLGVIGVIIGALMEDKTKPFAGNMKYAAMGGFALMALAGLITILRLSSAKGSGGELAEYMTRVKVSPGLGLFLCIIVGVLGLLWVAGVVKLPDSPSVRPPGSSPPPM